MNTPRLSQEFLTNLAGQIVRNEVFATNTEEGLNNSFGTLLMFMGEGMNEEELHEKYKDVGGMWEFKDKAEERSVDGWPMFLSGHIIHRLDCIPLYKEVERLETLIDGNVTTGDTPEARDDDAGGSDEVPGSEPEGVAPGSPPDEKRPQA